MKVGIVIPTIEKYRKYTEEAVQSVINQELPCDFVCVKADGMTVGKATNIGVAQLPASCEYVMRLDCDDYLHPMAALVMSTMLDRNPDHPCVYTGFWTVSGEQTTLGEQPYPPHPGCMMIRRSVFELVGGFSDMPRQEGTDFWYRINAPGLGYYYPLSITLPLWYYRRHGENASNAHNEVVKARQEIREAHESVPKILCVIPARGGSKGIPRKNLEAVGGIPLVARTIKTAKDCKHSMLVVVSTEDHDIALLAYREGVDAVIDRPADLASDEVSLVPVAKHAMEHLDRSGWAPDIVVTMQPTAPFTAPGHVDEALNILEAQEDLDSVVTVCEMARHPYRSYSLVGGQLYPFFVRESEKFLQRQDRKLNAYQFTGGVYARRRHLLDNWEGGFAIGATGAVVVPRSYGVDIDDYLDLWLARAIAENIGDWG